MTTAAEHTGAERAARFLELHHGSTPLLMPNPWDIGSAKLLASLGFEALATTSSGFAATLGRLDGHVTRDEAIHHGGALAAAVEVPVSADLEHGFADDPGGVAATFAIAAGSGLAGASIEDSTGRPDDPIYEAVLAAERVAAAVESAHTDQIHFVVTARCENWLHGHDDLGDTIARLQSYQEAGADVLFAPGVSNIDDIETIVRAVDRPLNVLVRPGGATVAELASVGVRRISVGGSLAWVAYAAVVAAAEELQAGTLEFLAQAPGGVRAARAAFG